MKRQRKTTRLIGAAGMLLMLLGLGAMAADAATYDVEAHVITQEEQAHFALQTQPDTLTGTAYLPRNDGTGTNGGICAPFRAELDSLAFVLTSAPGATAYNVQLYAGQPGDGVRTSHYATADVNNGVCFTGLTAGQDYYLKISSNSLSTAGCTAVYTMLQYQA